MGGRGGKRRQQGKRGRERLATGDRNIHKVRNMDAKRKNGGAVWRVE